MAKEKDIVAAELLSVKDKVSLLDAIAFPIVGDHIAGPAGALVGASLIPSKLIYTWRVLYADGTQSRIKLDGTDLRNNWLMELPYLPDYVAFMESREIVDSQLSSNTPHEGFPKAAGTPTPIATQQTAARQAGTTGEGVVIGAGHYEFGSNFPEGIFNLEHVSGKGTLQLQYKDGWLIDQSFGDPEDAKSYFGLSSNEYGSFKLDGNLQLKVSRASMIQI